MSRKDGNLRKMKVVWIKPDDNAGTITRYDVYIKDDKNAWVSISTAGKPCNGIISGMNFGIVTVLTCEVPYSTWTDYAGIKEPDTVQVQVTATNAEGESEKSGESSPAIKLAVKPAKATALERHNDSNMKDLKFKWTAPTDTGGSPITKVTVKWDKGSGSSDVKTFEICTNGEITSNIDSASPFT